MRGDRADVNKFVQYVLTGGVALSMLTLVWGSVLFLGAHVHVEPGHTGRPGSIPEILRGVVRLDPVATINLGLLILLLTPVARVMAAGVAFAIDKDRRYVLISLAVLGVLILSAVLGHLTGRG